MMNAPRALIAALLAAAVPAFALHPSAPVPRETGRPMTPIIIDPGHGGDDFGAVVKGLREKDLALAFAQKLKRRLAQDHAVVLTRQDDRYVTLDDRVVGSVDLAGAAFVSLHLNQVRGTKASGAIIYSYGRDKHQLKRKRLPSVPPMPAPPRVQSRDSETLALALSKSMRAAGFRAETAKSDYYVLKNPAQPSVLIELGYLNNPSEAVKLSDPDYQDRMVESLAKALEEFTAPDVVAARE